MQKALDQGNGTIHLKNAGTCMRFLTAYFAAKEGCEVTLLCDERMEKRPIDELVNALKLLGADIHYLHHEGFPPLSIKGKKLAGGKITISAKSSSQFVSAVMLIAPFCNQGMLITLEGAITSAPYIEMTAKLMQQLGVTVELNFPIIQILPISNVKNQIPNISIEPDWSAASYWYELVALSKEAELFLPGLSLDSIQGDAMIAAYMEYFGVQTTETTEGVVIRKQQVQNPKPKTINLQNQPDLAPTLAVTAAATNSPLLLTGLQNLAIKESNRLQSLETELTKLGFQIKTSAYSLELLPLSGGRQYEVEGSAFHSPTFNILDHTSHVSTYGDHRMAMAFAPLALLFGNITIENPDVVEKSYPHFWEDLKTLGFKF
jgi:3-phosphoshikimate 1-carboxyvinyltransferase